MVLKYIIIKPTQTKHGDHFDLCLRRRSGRIWKRACKQPDQTLLLNWYNKYNQGKPLEQFNRINAIKAEILSIKKQLWKLGIKHQVSFYGVLQYPATSTPEYRRYEIFSREKFSREQFTALMDNIRAKPPAEPYGVFLALGIKLMQIKPKLLQTQVENFVYADRSGNTEVKPAT